jgi:DNA-binding transcriptional regulator YdaS (Cro superfamily)
MTDLTIGVKAAIQAFGTRTALAKKLHLKRAAISQWKQVPVKHVLTIEDLTNGAVSRYVMRPDVYRREAA